MRLTARLVRESAADGIDVAVAGLWLTEHPTDEGKLYCAAVMGAYSRRIIGWSIVNHLRT